MVALLSVALWSAVAAGAVVLEAAALWSAAGAVVVAGAVVLEAAALWSVAGAVVVAGAAVLEAAALWSVVDEVLGVVAGGFTGALALSEAAPAGLVEVVAAAALALLVSVVGVWLLPGATGVLLALWFDALVEEVADWSVVAGAAVLEASLVVLGLLACELAAAASVLELGAAPVLAWLLVQESEIMLTELTWMDPSLARDPWICTWCPSCGFRTELSPCRLTLWPLSEASTQFPPDCFKQPLMEAC